MCMHHSMHSCIHTLIILWALLGHVGHIQTTHIWVLSLHVTFRTEERVPFWRFFTLQMTTVISNGGTVTLHRGAPTLRCGVWYKWGVSTPWHPYAFIFVRPLGAGCIFFLAETRQNRNNRRRREPFFISSNMHAKSKLRK